MKRLPAILSSLMVLCLMACSDTGPPASADDAPLHPLPFKAENRYLWRWNGAAYQPMFIKGVNLGAGIPGTEPGQLAITRDQYRRWLPRMVELGFNVVRVYTLHHPRFYDELNRYNRSNPDKPIYVIQGIWLDEENPTGDFYDLTGHYNEEIEYVIDAVHGNASVPLRYGKAFGTYAVDASRWILGWVVGREIYAWEVNHTGSLHPEISNFEGHHLRLPSGTPFEAWVAQMIDEVVAYEQEGYGVLRPISFSSWPTLDPMSHPIQPPEDEAQVDLSNLDLFDAPGGFYAIYHTYPFYPDFLSESPEHYEAGVSDDLGLNSYLAYLHDLSEHYGDTPLLIGEYGLPSSWGNAHYSQTGMHHGGLDEGWVGVYASRMLQNIREARTAGGVYFAWADEWWKTTWVTRDLDFPKKRRFLWHNVTTAEQSFGLIAFDIGEPQFEQWAPLEYDGPIRRLSCDTDASFFHLRFDLAEALTEPLVIGFDTYRDDLGESVLPLGIETDHRSELALVVEPDAAQLHVTEAYNLYGIWHSSGGPEQLFHSTRTDGAPWMPVRWKTNGRHRGGSTEYTYPETFDAIGTLQVRTTAEPMSNLDAVVIGDTRIEVRLPWTLLQFSDPSRLRVIDDDRSTEGHETSESKGIRLVIALSDQRIVTNRLRWDPWDEPPPTTEREKAGLMHFSETIRAMPEKPDGL